MLGGIGLSVPLIDDVIRKRSFDHTFCLLGCVFVIDGTDFLVVVFQCHNGHFAVISSCLSVLSYCKNRTNLCVNLRDVFFGSKKGRGVRRLFPRMLGERGARAGVCENFYPEIHSVDGTHFKRYGKWPPGRFFFFDGTDNF